MSKHSSISVVIPVYESEQSLEALYKRLTACLVELSDQYEIILVDDGSNDDSWSIIRNISSHDDRIRGFRLSRNFGQHNALLCGILAARYDFLVTMDDDLQNPPEEIRKLLDKLAEGYDVVYGTPKEDRHELWRNAASWITKTALQKAMGVKGARGVSAFRAFRKSLRPHFQDYRSPYIVIDVLLSWSTTRFASVTVEHNERMYGKSAYSFRKLITHALNMITGFSTLPLKLASLIGFSLTLFGLIVLAYVIGRYFIEGGSVPGFPFLASVIAIFSGAQLFTLGIFGEYLARMHFRLTGRPVYVVHETSSASDKILPSSSSEDFDG